MQSLILFSEGDNVKLREEGNVILEVMLSEGDNVLLRIILSKKDNVILHLIFSKGDNPIGNIVLRLRPYNTECNSQPATWCRQSQ